MGIYADFGVKPVINCSGKMTYLGSSVLNERVAQAMVEASQNYVFMDDLIAQAGKKAAALCHSEDATFTCGASAGIIISVAAMINRGNPLMIEEMPYPKTSKRKILIQKGHMIHFGAPIKQMIEMAGGEVIEVGNINRTADFHLEENIDADTAAIVFAQSHHSLQSDMIPLTSVIQIAKQHHIPLIVDAAAEEDMHKYIEMGSDLVIYSGAKAFEGPTSGIIAGSKELIELCRKQSKGVGRPLKIGKENIAGLLQAMMLYEENRSQKNGLQAEILHRLQEGLNSISGLTISISKDTAGRAIERLKIAVNPEFTMNAVQLDQQLKEGDVIIFTRNHHADLGYIELDPRPMRLEDCDIVIQRIKQIVSEENK